MSIARLQQARERLDRAVGHLETATKRKLAAKSNGDARLADELREVQTRCETLEKRSRAVSERLDATIDRIRGLLDEA